MNKILMYSTATCTYCVSAKQFLEGRGLAFEEVRVDLDPEQFATMLARSNGRRTVPQIFIGERHVGGYDDMMKLHREGALDTWLTSTP